MSLDTYFNSLLASLDGYKKDVVKYSIQKSHEEADRFSLPAGGHNDQRDAFRHAYISAEFTYWFGPGAAKILMDDYEASNPNDASETNMDLWNNDQGRQIGEEALNDWTNLLDPDIGQRVNDKLQKGDLITDTSDLRKWVEPPPGGIFQNIQDFIDSTIDEIGGKIGEFYNDLVDLSDIVQIVSDFFTTAIGTALPPPRRDPLILDLDGDGTETIGVEAGAYFDHDANGFAEQTGWASPDDGLLVRDINDDGIINNGRELFGDNTLLKSGAIATDGLQALADLDDNGEIVGKAEDGFDALAQEDTNSDGVVDSNDANFTNLRIWQDLNQDGISQSNELKTLTEAGIASISVTKTEHSKLLPNGNVIADLGTYTRTDGSTAGLGTTAQLGDVDLNENTFYSEFTDTIPLTDEAALLPNMNGSGQVRDLSEAASLSPAVASALTAYAQATTRAEQLALLDNLIKAWSDTSLMLTTATGAYAGHPLTINLDGVTAGTPQYQAWLDKITIMEHYLIQHEVFGSVRSSNLIRRAA